MTSRQRLTAVLSGELPDCVPVAPDTSNMIPVKMTGLPFWDVYLYQKIPQWKAYIDCVKYFGFDSLMDGYAEIRFEDLEPVDTEEKTAIVYQDETKIITQRYKTANGKRFWSETVTVYPIDNPPVDNVPPGKMGLMPEPAHYKELEGVCEWPAGEELLALVKREMGECGLVGVGCGVSCLLYCEEDVYRYYDEPEYYYEMRDRMLSEVEARYKRLMSLSTKPDFICTGCSGSLVWQTPAIFRELALPIVKKVTDMAYADGIFTHVHSCGPEAELVEILANETHLTVIDPLEIPPMGNCNLREIKQKYGDKIVLKGNLHTTDVMLKGSVEQVREAAKRAIDDAAEGGGFILSTGDQCGRDTPPENLFAMIETARKYGKY